MPTENHIHLKPLAVRVKTACEILGVGHTTIYELIKQKKIEKRKIGGRTLLVYSSLEALLAPVAA